MVFAANTQNESKSLVGMNGTGSEEDKHCKLPFSYFMFTYRNKRLFSKFSLLGGLKIFFSSSKTERKSVCERGREREKEKMMKISLRAYTIHTRSLQHVQT